MCKSFRKTNSAFSTPNQAYLSFEGFENVLKIFVKDIKTKVFPQFAGSTIIVSKLPTTLLQQLTQGTFKQQDVFDCLSKPQWQTEVMFLRSVTHTQYLQSGRCFTYEVQNVVQLHHSFSASL